VLDFIPADESKLLKKFYPMAYGIYSFFENKLHMPLRSGKADELRKLYTGFDSTMSGYLYFCRLFSIIILVVLSVDMSVLVYTAVPAGKGILQKGYYIKRDKPGGSGKEEDLSVSIGSKKRDLSVSIPAKKYDNKEYNAKLKEAMEYTRNNYLGENKSQEKVINSLNLVSYIPDNAISISWEYDTAGIVNEDGSLMRAQLKEPEAVQIKAVFSYSGKEKEMPLEFTVLPIDKSQDEMLWDKWEEMFVNLSELTADKDFLQLPALLDGQKILYGTPYKNYTSIIIFTGVLVIAFIPAVTDSRIKEKTRQREQELRLDYPGFIEKFVLLISAGLNCKSAWSRMTEEYSRKLEDGGKKRYLYEEMLLTKKQIENGMNEAKAYELFGKRIGLLKYMKFSTMLVQNLKKGSAGLLKILDYEAADVLKERRENAKMLGEQAGTKLLMPMILMMAEVFAIIIIAAFQNM